MPKNGSHIGCSLFPSFCSDSCFVEILTRSVSSIISVQTTSVLEEIVENVWKKVLMPQVSNVYSCFNCVNIRTFPSQPGLSSNLDIVTCHLFQVGLVAVNVIGDRLDSPYDPLEPDPVSNKEQTSLLINTILKWQAQVVQITILLIAWFVSSTL